MTEQDGSNTGIVLRGSANIYKEQPDKERQARLIESRLDRGTIEFNAKKANVSARVVHTILASHEDIQKTLNFARKADVAGFMDYFRVADAEKNDVIELLKNIKKELEGRDGVKTALVTKDSELLKKSQDKIIEARGPAGANEINQTYIKQHLEIVKMQGDNVEEEIRKLTNLYLKAGISAKIIQEVAQDFGVDFSKITRDIAMSIAQNTVDLIQKYYSNLKNSKNFNDAVEAVTDSLKSELGVSDEKAESTAKEIVSEVNEGKGAEAISKIIEKVVEEQAEIVKTAARSIKEFGKIARA